MESWEKLSFKFSDASHTSLLSYLREIFNKKQWIDKLNNEVLDIEKVNSFHVIIDGLNVLYSEAKEDYWLVEISRYKRSKT
jgi:hypothetical protein